MFEIAQVAGLLAGDSLSAVMNGDTVIPSIGYIDSQQQRQLHRLFHDRLEDGVEFGMQQLKTNSNNAISAVLVYDGRITLEDGKIDAVLFEIRVYEDDPGQIVFALPYSPATETEKFTAHQLKVIEMSPHLQKDFQGFFNNFFEGVDQHADAGKFWC